MRHTLLDRTVEYACNWFVSVSNKIRCTLAQSKVVPVVLESYEKKGHETMNELRTPYLLQTNLPPALISPSFFIIEKNIAIATMIRWILELAGYRSTHITEVSPLSELSLPNSPALTLLDISLPLRSGSKVLADIHSTYASLGIPSLIIVLTTNKDIQKEVKAMGYRALMKPFHLQDLHQAIQETLYSRGTRYNCSLQPQKICAYPERAYKLR